MNCNCNFTDGVYTLFFCMMSKGGFKYDSCLLRIKADEYGDVYINDATEPYKRQFVVAISDGVFMHHTDKGTYGIDPAEIYVFTRNVILHKDGEYFLLNSKTPNSKVFIWLNGHKKTCSIYIIDNDCTTGKSLILAVLRSVIGEDLVSSVTIQQLEKQEYAAEMNGKKINIAADLPDTPLKDVGMLKALVSNLDIVSARRLYHNPEKQKGTTKVFCSTNHLLKFKNPDPADLEALFNRIIFLPLLHVIKAEDVDTNLIDTLLDERDYIFTWAVKGLRRYLKNGEMFTTSDLSEKIKNENISRYNFAKAFTNDHIELDENSWVLKTDVAKAYYDAVAEAGLPNAPKTEIYNCLEHMGITGVKKTVKGLGQQWIFKGIRLK